MQNAGRIGDRGVGVLSAAAMSPEARGASAVTGSTNVIINNRSALRVGDFGGGTSLRSGHVWMATQGAPCVLINGGAAYRVLDESEHRGSKGALVEGSYNVIIGNYSETCEANAVYWVAVEVRDAFGDPIAGLPFEVRGPISFQGRTAAGAIKRLKVPPGTYRLRLL